MTTSWNEESVVGGFESYDDTLENLLGYPYVYEALGLTHTQEGGTWLDYGCGPGKVAARFAKDSKHFFYAVDESESMIDIANQVRSNPFVDYKLIKDNDLPFIPDNSLNGAMLCFVLLNLKSRLMIETILSTILHKLKPGAPCVILDTHPDSTGLSFTTFQSGLPNAGYHDSDTRPAWLFLPDRRKLVLEGCYWSQEAYLGMCKNSGYININLQAPILKHLPQERFATKKIYRKTNVEKTTEWHSPPYLILRGEKSQ